MRNIRILIALMIVVSFTQSFTTDGNQDWSLLETKNFKIYFPQKPELRSQILNTQVGELNIDMYMYQVPDTADDSNFAYSLAVTEYPDSLINSNRSEKELIDNFFNNSIGGYTNNVHGKLKSELIIKYDSFPGREIKVEIKEGLAVIRTRMYLVQNKVYMLQVITDIKKDFNRSINRFLNSFVLLQ